MRRVVLMVMLGTFALAAAAVPAGASEPTGELPSGERIVGKTVMEPVYEDMTGEIRYVGTPMGVPTNPVNSNPKASAPFYLPVYPTGSTVGPLLCQDVPVENCPDHGPLVAGAAEAIDPAVYGEGVIGHDHLMAGPASGGDFNVAWVPVLVLFTSKEAANTHITTLAKLEEMVSEEKVFEVPLNGSNGTPNLTFHCDVISPTLYQMGAPFTG